MRDRQRPDPTDRPRVTTAADILSHLYSPTGTENREGRYYPRQAPSSTVRPTENREARSSRQSSSSTFRPTESREASNSRDPPPYTSRPTAGETTIGMGRNLRGDPPSYMLSQLSRPAHVYEERRSSHEDAGRRRGATPEAVLVSAADLFPTRTGSRSSTQGSTQARHSGTPPPPYRSSSPSTTTYGTSSYQTTSRAGQSSGSSEQRTGSHWWSPRRH